jgi:glycosyltransferase involved in cell wall biosynthesis
MEVFTIVNIVIPTYRARDTLPSTLDSLVSQTKKLFLVTIVQDGDGEDYSDIITEYKRRGLKIFLLQKENGGPGMARQYGMDRTQMCDYVMFVDSDDILNPRAVEVLYREAKLNNFDVLSSSFLAEKNHTPGIYLDVFKTPVTWCHGKIYKLAFLRENNIRFLEDLKLNEDSYFNLVAVNCATRTARLEECTYIWKDNPNSLTRDNSDEKFFFRANTYYILGQIRGLKKVYEVTGNVKQQLIGATLKHIYDNMMLQLYYNHNDYSYLNELNSLREFKPVQDFLTEASSWIYMDSILKATHIIDNSIIFYKQRFVDWVLEYIQAGSKENNDIYS